MVSVLTNMFRHLNRYLINTNSAICIYVCVITILYIYIYKLYINIYKMMSFGCLFDIWDVHVVSAYLESAEDTKPIL